MHKISLNIYTGLFFSLQNSIEQWRQVFYTSIAVVLVSTFIFIIFGDLRPQAWGIAKPQIKGKIEPEYEELISESEDSNAPPKKEEEDKLVY